MEALRRKYESASISPGSASSSSAAAELREAFEVFSRAGKRLERRYRELQAESRRLRQRLQAKDEEIKRSERLAMLGETAAGIAHEVRNPLGAIKLYVSLLKRDLCDRPAALALVEEIGRSVTTLENVVANILQFSKDGSACSAPVNMHVLIQEQVSQFAASEKRMTFELNLQGNPYITGDEHALGQVLRNLILNAVQAVKGEGRVKISTSDRGGALETCVQDDGPGIETAVWDKIFDPFVTTKGNGTGLGLAIVKKIIDRHGGMITAENQGGARFSVVLPRGGVDVGDRDGVKI